MSFKTIRNSKGKLVNTVKVKRRITAAAFKDSAAENHCMRMRALVTEANSLLDEVRALKGRKR